MEGNSRGTGRQNGGQQDSGRELGQQQGVPTLSLQEQFGQIDIYVFDQILRGNIVAGMRVLDAGCGYGRNLVHLLREGCEVFAVDADAGGVQHVRRVVVRRVAGLAGDLQQAVTAGQGLADTGAVPALRADSCL